MSSISLSASGARALSSTINSPAFTTASMPTVREDHINVQFGGFGETRVMLPLNARLELVKQGETAYLRLVLPANTGLLVQGRSAIEGVHSWPHVFVNAGKHIEDPYADTPADVVFAELRELVPPTE